MGPDETAKEQGNAGEDTADSAGAGYGDDRNGPIEVGQGIGSLLGRLFGGD